MCRHERSEEHARLRSFAGSPATGSQRLRDERRLGIVHSMVERMDCRRSRGFGTLVLLIACAAGACAAPQGEKTWWVDFRGPATASMELDGAPHRLPCKVVVEPESLLPLELRVGSAVLTGSIALGYAPRAALVADLDPALLEAASVEPLTLFGWSSDFVGECDLAFMLATHAAAADAVATRDLAERYTGPLSKGQLVGVFAMYSLAVLARGSATGDSGLDVAPGHSAGSAWIDDEGRVHGLRQGDAAAFVRPFESDSWLGPLWARGASADSDGQTIEAGIADALPALPARPSFAVGEGTHGTLALGLEWTRNDQEESCLRLDVRMAPRTAEVVVVAVVRGHPSELSISSSHVVRAADPHRVIVWSPSTDEMARGPLELCWRHAAEGTSP